MCTCVSGATLAPVVVGELDAAVRAPRVAGVGETLVDVPLASLPHVSCRADAVVAAHPVHTPAAVEALWLLGDGVGGRGAVVLVDLAVHTLTGERRSKRGFTHFTEVKNDMHHAYFVFLAPLPAPCEHIGRLQ